MSVGIFLEAIVLAFWFAQVLDILINKGLACLFAMFGLLKCRLICYDFCSSRKCTLKTKYDIVFRRGRIQSLQNPFRDWNCAVNLASLSAPSWFKASKTLLGIETWFPQPRTTWSNWFKASKTLLGIETNLPKSWRAIAWGFKASKTLLGIETNFARSSLLHIKWFKASKTLLGIETLHPR